MGAECLGVDGGCVEVDKFYLLVLHPWGLNSSVREVGISNRHCWNWNKIQFEGMKTFFIAFSNVYCCVLPTHPSFGLTFKKVFVYCISRSELSRSSIRVLVVVTSVV